MPRKRPRPISACPAQLAAQYVRMSTDQQQYSTDNQLEAIGRYADLHQIQIVQSYSDRGKSGLSLEGRSGLKSLIEDVTSGDAKFNIVLVFDVSRWGRFQDVDEGAYLEYLCKLYGIEVRYCAEQFSNDGSMSSTIIKSMKRAMAGEYSRDLSAKVFAGQCRLTSLGFRQGGLAGYGLRRQLVNSNGQLAHREWKSLQTDRVVLTLGPKNEIKIVREIYRLFVKDRIVERDIAALLNERGDYRAKGFPWTYKTIREILTNEKYIGNNIRNRTSFKLNQARTLNPPNLLLRVERAFTPLIGGHLFEQAQSIIGTRYAKYSDEQMIKGLSALFVRAGKLTSEIIDQSGDIPISSSYVRRFGSLLNAYRLAGYAPIRDYQSREDRWLVKALYPSIRSNLISALEMSGATVERSSNIGPLKINGDCSLLLILAQSWNSKRRSRHWKIKLNERYNPDISIIARLSETNTAVVDYFFIPRADFPSKESLLFLKDDDTCLDAFRFDTFEKLAAFAGTILGRSSSPDPPAQRGIGLMRAVRLRRLQPTSVF